MAFGLEATTAAATAATVAMVGMTAQFVAQQRPIVDGTCLRGDLLVWRNPRGQVKGALWVDDNWENVMFPKSWG